MRAVRTLVKRNIRGEGLFFGAFIFRISVCSSRYRVYLASLFEVRFDGSGIFKCLLALSSSR